MERGFRAVAYWIALIAVSILVLSIAAAIFATFVDVKAHAHLWSEADVRTAVISYGALLLGAITAFSGVFFGWRKDRREVRDLELKTKDLELKLKAAKDKQ